MKTIHILLTVLCIAACSPGLQQGQYDEYLDDLDETLRHAEEYESMKEQKISSIENMLHSRGVTPLQQYYIYANLFEECKSFQFDMAKDAVDRQIALADTLGDGRLRTDAMLDKAGLLPCRAIFSKQDDLSVLDLTLLTGLQIMDATDNPSLTAIHVWSSFSEPAGFSKPETAEYVYPGIDTPAGYKLVWQEEFDNAPGGLPDTGVWYYETAEPGWVNNELQTYIAGKEGDTVTAEVSSGTLKITALKDGDRVCSARINTRESWTYGYFEARLKLPEGKGTWPAFWMMPATWSGWPDGGEIDIMEHVGCVPGEVSSSIHCKSYYHAIGTQKTAARTIPSVMDEFHVYALEWTPEYIRTYVDGELLFDYNPDDYPEGRTANTWPFNKPFQLKLNLAWGGDWGGMYGVDETCLPAVYEIDYVRVFQKPQ